MLSHTKNTDAHMGNICFGRGDIVTYIDLVD